MNTEIEELRKVLIYDAASGVLSWRVTVAARARAGREVGCIDGEGYRTFVYRRKQYLAHRVIWAIVTGAWPTEIDHRNRVRDDNRWENLRDGSHLENCANRALPPVSATGERCVYVIRSGLLQVEFRKNGKKHYVGVFADIEEARAARDRAMAQLERTA